MNIDRRGFTIVGINVAVVVFVLSLVLAPAAVLAQTGWQLQGLPALEAGVTYNLRDVKALSGNQAWIAGGLSNSEAVLLKTLDGGTWNLTFRKGLSSPDPFHSFKPFARLSVVDSNNAWTASTMGITAFTADGGTTWSRETSPCFSDPAYPPIIIYGLKAVTGANVWTTGWTSYDYQGQIWHRPYFGDCAWWWWPWRLEASYGHATVLAIDAVDASNAWAVGYPGIVHTTDGGNTWVTEAAPTGGLLLADVSVVSPNVAWAVGAGGLILKTINAGANWVVQGSDVAANLLKVSAVSADVAWVVGENGTILKTTNGGTTWIRQLSGTSATLFGVAAVDSNVAWIVGEVNMVLHTTDGGGGTWPAPTITTVTPNLVGQQSSPLMTVTITGTGFRGGNVGVLFGDTPAAGVTWVNTTTLQAIAPYGIGTFSLRVTNEDGQSATLPNAITFVPYPVMTNYSPWHGPASGGYQITVDGFNLQTVSSAELYSYVDFQYYPLQVTVVDSTRVLVTVPVSATRPEGKAILILNTAQNQMETGDDFLLDPPGGPTFAIDSITPRSGPSGTTVTVTGVGFSLAATLSLCENEVTITSRSATQLVGQVHGNAGSCYLWVTNTESQSLSINPAFLLVAAGPAPTISQISPAFGSTAGGRTVTITGTGFSATDTVTFDGYWAAVISRTATSMVVTSPPHAPGPVSVIVMPEDLARLAAIRPGGFTYDASLNTSLIFLPLVIR